MAKFQLGSAPKTFKRKVSFPLISGGTGEISFEFNFRNKTQFAEFIDEIFPELRDGKDAAANEGIDVVGNSVKAVATEVAYILGAAKEWDLDDDLNEANVRQLVIDFPAASTVIMTVYREACNEGKAKN